MPFLVEHARLYQQHAPKDVGIDARRLIPTERNIPNPERTFKDSSEKLLKSLANSSMMFEQCRPCPQSHHGTPTLPKRTCNHIEGAGGLKVRNATHFKSEQVSSVPHLLRVQATRTKDQHAFQIWSYWILSHIYIVTRPKDDENDEERRSCAEEEQ